MTRARWPWQLAAGALAAAAVAVVAASAIPARAKGRDGASQKVSYGMGVALARSFQRQGDATELDVDAIARGMRDALAGGKLLFPEEELRSALGAFQAELKQRQQKASRAGPQAAAPPARSRQN